MSDTDKSKSFYANPDIDSVTSECEAGGDVVVDTTTLYESDCEVSAIEPQSKKERKRLQKQLKKKRKQEKKDAKLLKKNHKPYYKRRWRIGDRRDGRRLRSITPMAKMIPYIMKVRADAQNHFEDEIDITNIEKYLNKKHEQGYKTLSLLHVLLASYVRCIAQRPGINRFCAGQKIYARNNIECVMSVKKEMKIDSPDTMIKVEFDPRDTVLEIAEKFDSTVKEALSKQTNFDKTAKLFTLIPGIFLRFAVGALRFLDYFGLLPKKIADVSPFHGSFIITSMGSLGINAIYHHLYDFGNLPVFLCYGKKFSRNVIMNDGTVKKRSFITFKAVTDERICDGYYYASAFKIINRQLQNPECLDIPPATVVEDVD
ncbi:MAG: hypothetical protein SOZ62_03400 [Eubacteriales bacterium]|nr:hypothetical protein [Eubacteriales bacterium]